MHVVHGPELKIRPNCKRALSVCSDLDVPVSITHQYAAVGHRGSWS